MSNNLDDLRAQLDALNQLRHGGEAEVTYQANGVLRRTRYRSYDELVRAIADLENRSPAAGRAISRFG